MAKVAELVATLAEPVVTAQGCTLWDVEYVKEAGSWYLRVYIDKEGGVSIDDCEAVSRALDPMLDETDPIPDAYTFEVSSAGADRVLKKPAHFQAFLGELVDVKLYKPRQGRKEFTGPLAAYEDGGVTLALDPDPLTLNKDEIAQVRLHVSF